MEVIPLPAPMCGKCLEVTIYGGNCRDSLGDRVLVWISVVMKG